MKGDLRGILRVLGVREIMHGVDILANTVKTTPEQYRAQIDQEIAQWKPFIQEIAEKK